MTKSEENKSCKNFFENIMVQFDFQNSQQKFITKLGHFVGNQELLWNNNQLKRNSSQKKPLTQLNEIL